MKTGTGWAPTGVSAAPVIDDAARPYVFDHVVPNQYASALAIFSAGTSHTWLRDILGLDYAEMDAAASAAGVGCGLWPGFDVVERVSSISDEAWPDPAAHAAYEALYARFRSLAGHLGAWAMERPQRESAPSQNMVYSRMRAQG